MPPRREMTVPSCGPKVSLTCPGSGTPDVTTSEPVRTMPTTGLACTCRLSWPATAARAMWPGFSVVPAGISTSPAAASSPAGRMCWPGAGSPSFALSLSRRRRLPSVAWWICPLSLRSIDWAPAGTSPPVAMTLASPGGQKGFAVGKDPWTAAVGGPAVHGRGVVMGEFLQGGDIAGQGVACRERERDFHGRERDRAIESQLPGFGPGGGGMSGRSPCRVQLRSAAAGGGFLGEQRCPLS